MKTFLFVWNADKWGWENLEQSIEELKLIGRVRDAWSCASHKSINIGDRAFLIKLGQNPRGIFASGYIATKPFLSPHWSGEDKLTPKVIIDFDVLLNPNTDPILPIEILKQNKLSIQHWESQSSGISIKPEIVDELESVWFNFLASNKINLNLFLSNEFESATPYLEGQSVQTTLTIYERNPYARQKCIEHYGYACSICNFNFEKVFGEVGNDFIHVHHLNQISNVKEEYEIDPIKDLRPVCPNCHAIIHRRKIAYSIEEVKEFINQY